MLRRPTASDAAWVAALFACPEVARYPWGRPLTESEAVGLLRRWLWHWETQGFGTWIVGLRDGVGEAGVLGLTVPDFLPEILPAVEVGWRLHPEYWGRGIASEGAQAAVAFAWEELGLDRLVSVVQPGNARSRRVAERLGMRPARRLMHPRRRLPLVVYELDRELPHRCLPADS